jgi:lantibiotic biosynthesis protein
MITQVGQGSWCSWLTGSQKTRALAVAEAVATRLRSPALVEDAIVAAREQASAESSVRWTGHSLAQGWSGIALTCAQLDRCFPHQRWNISAHEYLARAVNELEKAESRPSGLWSGLTGLSYTARYLSIDGRHYRRLVAALDAVIATEITAKVQWLADRYKGISVGEYDLISGVSGDALYLLTSYQKGGMETILSQAISSLAALTLRNEDGIPRWHSPPERLDAQMQERFPTGNLNCGLAHGLPGLLAALSLGYMEGNDSASVRQAILRSADWLVDNIVSDGWGIGWPMAVPLGSPKIPVEVGRSAWCYGTPGVARALWLAGNAVGRPDLQQLAVAAMEVVYKKPPQARQIVSPTFCHGIAGLLQITLRFANDTHYPLFVDAARALTHQLLESFDEESILGYRTVHRVGQLVDQPGLLDGAPGCALVLLAAAHDTEPSWDRVFAIA